jgi:hypothetical protein
VELTVLNLMFLSAFLLLVVLTGGIAYLTAAEWRDRRRQQSDERTRR